MWPWNKPPSDLPNRANYDAVEKQLRSKDAPTVGDALRAMRRQGNSEYHRAFGVAHERRFGPLSQPHEIAHYTPRIGHTMQQEEFQSGFQIGLEWGAGIRLGDAHAIEKFQNRVKGEEYWHMHHVADSWNESLQPASKTNRAVYLAGGMYLREKIDAFLRSGLAEKSYDEQRRFCEQYADGDHTLPLNPATEDWQDLSHYPAALITLSPKEWRAIEAVALGIAPPERTDYPERLAAIKQALVVTGYYYDRPKSMVERVARDAVKEEQISLG